ncbi:MAG: DNA-binding protein WhiA [Synergistaceae bacterium]|nr:DNA-binding protein WhiA [Synergistaceae bacterium]
MTEQLWDEWRALPVEKSWDAEWECRGLIAGMPQLRTRRPWVARRLVTKLWPQTSWAGQGNIELDMRPSRNYSVAFRLPLALSGAEPEEEEALWAWIRGLFGSCGSLYLPRTSYYLALGGRQISGLNLRGILERTELVWRERDSSFILRSQEDIVTFLCNIGLTDSGLRLEDRAILRGARAVANRVSNCDTANIRRSLRVAEEQSRLARRLAREGVLPHLPPALRELALARLANPEASLSEIGEKLTPPIRKSTVKYRWARLSGYAGQK